MADLYFLPSGVPAPSWSWRYSPSTYHVKPGEFAIPAPSWSWRYAPSTQHVKPAPVLSLSLALGAPGGLALLYSPDMASVDTLTPSVTESASLFGSASLVDSLTPSVTDVVQALVLLPAADTLTPSVTDASALSPVLALTDGLTPSLAEAARVEWFTSNIPSSRPMYRSKDWTELVREADPDPPAYVKYRFSNGREFR